MNRYPDWLSLDALEPDPAPLNTVPRAPTHALEQSTLNDLGLPDWLSAGAPDPKRSLAARNIEKLSYDSFFQFLLDQLCVGRTLDQVIAADQRTQISNNLTNLDTSMLMRWITRDPERLSLLHEAMAIGAEFLMAETIRIADAEDNTLEDVRRSTARIDARHRLASSYARKRFAPSAQIDTTVGISITRALADANARLDGYVRQPLEVISVERAKRGEED